MTRAVSGHAGGHAARGGSQRLLLVALIAACAIDDRRIAPIDVDATNDAASGPPAPGGAGAEDTGSTPSLPGDAGALGGACGGCTLPHADGRCEAGRCVVARCLGPWLDANDSAADGCEAGDVPRAGLGLWLRADEGVVAENGQVSTWLDQSGLGLAATQPEPGSRPLVRVEDDGSPMLLFDGQDDALLLPPDTSALDGASFFAVVEALPDDLCSGILHFASGSDDIEFGRHGGGVLHYEVGGESVSGASGAFVTRRRLVVSAVQAGAGAGAAAGLVELRIDGQLDDVGVVGLPGTLTRGESYVGRNSYGAQPDVCSVFFQGLIGELLFYRRGVDDAERARVERYLREKWQAAR